MSRDCTSHPTKSGILRNATTAKLRKFPFLWESHIRTGLILLLRDCRQQTNHADTGTVDLLNDLNSDNMVFLV